MSAFFEGVGHFKRNLRQKGGVEQQALSVSK